MPMTPVEFAKRMREIFEGYDTEASHSEADKLMCEVLKEWGYSEGVTIFIEAERWYA